MDINNLAQNFIQQYGLISIFFIVTLEYANFPLPSEVVLPFVGIMIAQGSINFSLAIIISIIGGIIGCLINYLIGLYFGKIVLKYMVNKLPKTRNSVKTSMWWINKYGKASVMLARVVPVARTIISIPAGMVKMNLSIFIIYSTIGISIWNIILICLGYMLGDNLFQISYVLKNYSNIVIILLVVGILVFYSKKKNNNKNG